MLPRKINRKLEIRGKVSGLFCAGSGQFEVILYEMSCARGCCTGWCCLERWNKFWCHGKFKFFRVVNSTDSMILCKQEQIGDRKSLHLAGEVCADASLPWQLLNKLLSWQTKTGNLMPKKVSCSPSGFPTFVAATQVRFSVKFSKKNTLSF